jgi:parvulin-like peptidyl-prolyl isomerase
MNPDSMPRAVDVKTKALFVVGLAGCLALSCNRPPSSSLQNSNSFPPDVLARVEEKNIRLADYEAEIERRARGRSGSFAQTDEREALLQEMVNFESAYLRAKEAGFDQKPEIARQIKTFIVDRFIEEQMKGKPEAPTVSDAEIADYYRAYASRFALPEKVRFAVIQMGFSSKATEEKKAEALCKAESVLAEARALGGSNGGFGALAQRYSEDQATRYLGGDAGWLASGEKGRWDAAVVDAAFALKSAGDISPVIQTANRLCLVKLIEKKVAGCRPLEEVAEAIRYKLALEKRHRQQEEFHEAMTAGLKIEINRALLETISAPPSPPHAAPPALPGS